MKISIIIINYYFLLYSYMSKIGILDPNAKYDNPLTKHHHRNFLNNCGPLGRNVRARGRPGAFRGRPGAPKERPGAPREGPGRGRPIPPYL